MRPWLNDMPEKLFQSTLDTTTSPPLVTAAARYMWKDLVGRWANERYALGEPQSFLETARLHQMPVRPMRMTGEIAAKEMAPCNRAGQSRQCVVMELHSALTKEDREDYMVFLAPVARSGEKLVDANVTHSLRVVVEPNGLVPHSFTRTVETTVSIQNGAAIGNSRATWIETTSYSYPQQ
jgi:hypothetical protein